MTDYKQLCIELINELNGYKVAHPQHDTELIDRARAALTEPEPEGPTDDALLELYQGPGTFRAIEYARVHTLARCGRPAPQPVPVNERWPEFSDCDNAERVWCWNLRVGAWELSRIDLGIHSHWLPAHALTSTPFS